MSVARATLRMFALAGVAVSLIGCDTVREAAGVVKEPPDEFAVVTKSPLVIPPDFNLRPPKPGAQPTNQISPTESAQAALFGEDPATAAAQLPGNFSPEERIVLANSGGANADPAIRKQLASDLKSMEATDDSFTDHLLFGSPEPDKGAPLNADAEAQRLQTANAGGQQVASSPTASHPAPAKPQDSATINKDGDGGGWFDGIF
ncbi:MAG TPA: DUF3035 domain-containing protein [Rhizomicrobium sp.]|jgi:hypothetical protein|nr:DUF3035 domain-containing protein [Rhizomicrobium sp.]